MKKIFIYIFIICVSAIIYSCYDDDSTFADSHAPDVVIKNKKDKALISYFGSEFTHEPKISFLEGKDTVVLTQQDFDKFTYEWRISLVTNWHDTLSKVLSRERILITQMNKVAPSSDPYILQLDVTNKETSITRMFCWEIKVLSQYGQGILVAESKDGSSSDFSLLMSPVYNGNMEPEDEAIIHRGIYSNSNGSTFPGIISSISYLGYEKEKTITFCVKDHSVHVIDPITYQIKRENSDLFYFQSGVYKPQYVGNYSNRFAFILNNGKIQYYEPRYGNQYSYNPEYPYDFGEYVVNLKFNSGYYWGGCVFGIDKNTGKLIGTSNYGDINVIPENTEGAFNTGDFTGKELIFGDCGPSTENALLLLMKDQNTNQYNLYKFTATYETAKKPIGEALYDMSNCSDLKDATCFATSYKYDEFYYAVDNQLKVAIINNNTPTSKLSYEVPAGEKITHVLLHKGNFGKTTWGETTNEEGEVVPVWKDSHLNVLTLVSYNESTGEGFIRTLPIKYGGAGGIAEEKYVKTYSGFGKITAITTQY